MVAFIRQYQYNSDMAPDRTQLQNLCKNGHKSFKEYAQRWRDLEAQVEPPMMERELITMIVDTLPVLYYEKMVGYTPLSFANLVFVGERIKVGLKRGKFDYPNLMNEKIGAIGENEKKGGTHAMTAIPTWPSLPPAQQCHYSANIIPSHYPYPNHPQRPSLNQPQSLPATQLCIKGFTTGSYVIKYRSSQVKSELVPTIFELKDNLNTLFPNENK